MLTFVRVFCLCVWKLPPCVLWLLMNEKFRFVRVPYLLAEIPYFFVKLLIQLFAKLFLTSEWINSVVQILTKRTVLSYLLYPAGKLSKPYCSESQYQEIKISMHEYKPFYCKLVYCYIFYPKLVAATLTILPIITKKTDIIW